MNAQRHSTRRSPARRHDLALRVPPAFAAFDGWRAALHTAIELFTFDLGVASAIALDLGVDDDLAARHALTIDAHELRIRRDRATPADAGALCAQVLDDLIANRSTLARVCAPRARAAADAAAAEALFAVGQAGRTRSIGDLRLELIVAPGAASAASAADDQPLEAMWNLLRDGMLRERGLALPRLTLGEDAALAPAQFRIRINDLRLPPLESIGAEEMLVLGREPELRAAGIEGPLRATLNPASRLDCCIAAASPSNLNRCAGAGLSVWGRQGYWVLSAAPLIRRYGAAFVCDDTAAYMLDQLDDAFPDLVRNARRLGAAPLAHTLRALLNAGVGVQDLRSLLEGALSDRMRGRAPGLSPEQRAIAGARAGLAHQLCASHAADNLLRALAFDAAAQDKLERGADAALVARVRDAVESAWRQHGAAPGLVLAARPDQRFALEDMLCIEFPALPVVAFNELVPTVRVEPLQSLSV